MMQTSSSLPPDSAAPNDGPSAFDLTPPGERYFRHPGDVVRLVLWGTAALLLAVVIALGTDTTDGLTTDLGRVGGRVPMSVRELLLALTQVVAVAAPVFVAIGLIVTQRWRRLGLLALAGVAGAAAWVVLDL